MMNFQNYILNEISYLELFVLTLLYFLFLYFGIAPIFKRVCEWLEQKEFLVKIINKQVQKSQIKNEIKNSLSSIFVFGFSSLPLIFLYRLGQVSILENTFINVIFGLIIFNIWNEVHFYIIHKSLHHPFLMRNVHHIHHKSIIPTVYSIYSFHWVEALLLSSVPLIIVPFRSMPLKCI